MLGTTARRVACRFGSTITNDGAERCVLPFSGGVSVSSATLPQRHKRILTHRPCYSSGWAIVWRSLLEKVRYIQRSDQPEVLSLSCCELFLHALLQTYNGGSGGLWLILRIFATHKNIIAPLQAGITSHEKDFYIIKFSRLVGTLHGLR